MVQVYGGQPAPAYFGTHTRSSAIVRRGECVAAREGLVVEQSRVRRDGNQPAAGTGAPAQVDVVVRDRPALVKTAQLREQLTANHQARAADRGNAADLSLSLRGCRS